MDSNTNLDEFGRSGVLEVEIKTKDLEQKNFENISMSFQTT